MLMLYEIFSELVMVTQAAMATTCQKKVVPRNLVGSPIHIIMFGTNVKNKERGMSFFGFARSISYKCRKMYFSLFSNVDTTKEEPFQQCIFYVR